jgi:hypothetical protein
MLSITNASPWRRPPQQLQEQRQPVGEGVQSPIARDAEGARRYP